MPWWLYLYLIGYGIFTFFWVRDDLKDGGSKSLLAAELLSDACLVLVGLGYWLPAVRDGLGKAAPLAFVAGLAWALVAAARDIRETWPGSDTVLVRVGAVAFALGLYAIVCGPLLYWGFMHAVLGKTGGT